VTSIIVDGYNHRTQLQTCAKDERHLKYAQEYSVCTTECYESFVLFTRLWGYKRDSCV